MFSFLTKAWRGQFSLPFTFWVLGFLAPTPIFIGKAWLKTAGVFSHADPAIFIAGQAFLWLEWLYFAFITVALWNASTSHLRRARARGRERPVWGQASRALAAASGALALGSFANLSGLTTLVLGRPLYIGLGGG
jgi:hypothetical protein